MLQLKRLSINLQEWGSDKGQYQGEIEYVGDHGKVTLSLKNDSCVKLLPLVGDAIVASSKAVAADLTKEALQSITEQVMKIGG